MRFYRFVMLRRINLCGRIGRLAVLDAAHDDARAISMYDRLDVELGGRRRRHIARVRAFFERRTGGLNLGRMKG